MPDDDDVTPAEFVRSATELTRLPLVPELRLYLAGDIYATWEQTEAELGQTGLPPPFWSVAWPGGQALARYVLDHPDLVSGRTVVDYGSGSGLVALAAEAAGAAAVVAVEPDQLARAAIGLNAGANGLPVPSCVAQASGSGTLAGAVLADAVLAADVWYEQELAQAVGEYLREARSHGARLLLGDIGRRHFPRSGYRCLASYDVPSTLDLEGRELVRASVWESEN